MTISTDSEVRHLPTLSENTVNTLKSLREEDKDRFYALVAALRANKWPLRAFSEGLNVSRSIVSIWEKKGKEIEGQNLDGLVESLPEETLSSRARPMYSSYSLSDEQKDTLRELTTEASKVRRFTDPKSPARAAAAELEDLLHTHRDKGASLADLAAACGVSRRAVAQRLEKRKWQS